MNCQTLRIKLRVRVRGLCYVTLRLPCLSLTSTRWVVSGEPGISQLSIIDSFCHPDNITHMFDISLSACLSMQAMFNVLPIKIFIVNTLL